MTRQLRAPSALTAARSVSSSTGVQVLLSEVLVLAAVVAGEGAVVAAAVVVVGGCGCICVSGRTGKTELSFLDPTDTLLTHQGARCRGQGPPWGSPLLGWKS